MSTVEDHEAEQAVITAAYEARVYAARDAEQFVVSWGNGFAGITLTGPFADPAAAMEYAEAHAYGEPWEVVELAAPVEWEPTP